MSEDVPCADASGAVRLSWSMKARLLVFVLVSAVTAVMAPAAAARYTLGIDGTTVFVGPGSQSSIQVEYSSFCIVIFTSTCPPTRQSVASSSGVTFTNTTGGACTDNSGGDATRFSCPKRTRTQVTGTNGADEVTGACFGSGSTVSLVFNGFDGADEARASTCGLSQVDMGPGDDRASVAGTLSGGAGNDALTGSI